MSHVREILRPPAPPLLYHYSNQSGLLGIVRSKEIWASHTQFLNDQEEYRHAVSIARRLIQQMHVIPPWNGHADILNQMEEALEGIESINVCVCSFSERGDVLSQWRAYSGGTSGFSIGFEGQLLRDVADAIEFWLVPCQYKRHEQEELVQRLLEDVINEIIEWRTKERPPTTINRGGNLVAYLNRYAPIIKHHSFEEEREWRLISQPLMCDMERFDYRPGTSMLVPHYKIPLWTSTQPFKIRRLFIGPTPHPIQSKSSAEGMLIKHGLEHENIVVNSESPFRNW